MNAAEARLDESSTNIKRKDEKIAQLETVVQEKSDTVALLQSEIEVAQVWYNVCGLLWLVWIMLKLFWRNLSNLSILFITFFLFWLLLVQKKGTSDVAEQVGKAHARASELQKQVAILREIL